MAQTVVGHFPNRAAADSAYEDLVRQGFDRDDISILGRGREGGKGLADDDDHVSAGEGMAVGGIAGLLIGAAAMLIPGIGPIIAIGPISAALAGAVTGGVTGAVVGGIAGALIDAGVPEEDARYYNDRFQQGGYLLTVRSDDARANLAHQILSSHGADMRQPTAADRPTSGTTATSAGTARTAATTGNVTTNRGSERESVQLREEELRARKQTTEAGEVAIRKDVVTEQRSMEVPVTHEEVVVERHAVDRRPASSADFGTGREEIRVPVREEEVHLEKQAVVTEEITVGKRPVQETETVTGTVRKEVAHVERTGDVDVRGSVGGGDWSSVMPTYRTQWESRYGTTGERWDQYEPVYRYGWEMRSNPRYSGRSWAEAEPELRRDWESHNNMPWDKAGRALRETWDDVTNRR